MLMQPAGCYWITTHRAEDARALGRQAIAAQQSLTLISVGEAPGDYLTPPLPSGPDRIALWSLPDSRKALINLHEDFRRALPHKSGVILFITPVSLWEKLSAAEKSAWIKKIHAWLISQQSTLLIITWGANTNNLRNHLQGTFRQLDGLAHLEWQQDCWDYRIHWWSSEQHLVADRSLPLVWEADRFRQPDNTRQAEPLTQDDAHRYLAHQQVLEGAPPLSTHWALYPDNDDLAQHAQQASSATVIFCLSHNAQIQALAADIHSLRRNRGSGLKIVVREMQTSLRYSDERLLLACGVNVIVPHSATLSRFLTTLEGVQGQVYQRHVPQDLDALLKGLQPMQEKGFQPLETFCRSVMLLVNNPLLPENDKGLLVALRPVPELSTGQALSLCKPRRFGDLVTLVDDRLYLFLSSCRLNDLNTALKFIFRLPHDEIFSNRLVWHDDQQILSEMRQLRDRAPSVWQEAPAAPASAQPQPAIEAARRIPHPLTLGGSPAKANP